MTRRQSIALMLVAAILLGAWDLYVGFNNTEGDTFSEIIRDVSVNVLSIPLAFGIIMGHFFWNSERKPNYQPLIWLTGFCILRDIALIPSFVGANLVAFAIGVPAGAYYWPQKPGAKNVSG